MNVHCPLNAWKNHLHKLVLRLSLFVRYSLDLGVHRVMIHLRIPFIGSTSHQLTSRRHFIDRNTLLASSKEHARRGKIADRAPFQDTSYVCILERTLPCEGEGTSDGAARVFV